MDERAACVTGSKVEDAARLAPLATSLLSLGHQADSLTSVTVPCQSVAVWAVGRADCAQCSGCLVAAASLYRCWRDLHVRISTHESTQFSCSLVQTAPFPRHRGIPRHLCKFGGAARRGAACYSAARGKPWALVMSGVSLLQLCGRRTQLCRGRTVHLELSSNTATQMPSYIIVPS